MRERQDCFTSIVLFELFIKDIVHFSVDFFNRAFQGLSINEFQGLEFEHHHSFDIQSGEQVRTANCPSIL